MIQTCIFPWLLVVALKHIFLSLFFFFLKVVFPFIQKLVTIQRSCIKISVKFALQIAEGYRNKSIACFCSTWHRCMLLSYASPKLDRGRDNIHRPCVEFVKSEEEVTLQLSCRVVVVWGSAYGLQYFVMALSLLPSATAAIF